MLSSQLKKNSDFHSVRGTVTPRRGLEWAAYRSPPCIVPLCFSTCRSLCLGCTSQLYLLSSWVSKSLFSHQLL